MADNNLDPEEIRRLNESVKDLADSTTGLGTSFGNFGKTTDSTKGTVQKLNQELEKLLKKTAALTQTSSDSSRSGNRATKGFTAVAETSKELGKNFKGLNKATESLITQFNELGKTLSKITKIKPASAGPGNIAGTINGLPVLSEYEVRLKALGKKLDANGNIVDSLTKDQKENLRTIERENRIREAEDKKEDLRIRVREEGGKVYKEMTDRYKDGNAIFTDLNAKIFSLTGKSGLLTNAWTLLTGASKGLYNATTTMTKEVYNGARGADVSAKALKAFTDELGSATTAIGIAMMLIPGMGALRWAIRGLGLATVVAGQAIKKYGEYNELAAEQTKKLFGAFNSLSKSGVLLSGGIDEVFTQLQTMGMSVSQIDDFIKILGENSKTLKLFGDSTSEGAKKFVQVAGELRASGAGRELELLGVVADEQREHTLKYMSQQTKMGMAQFKTQAQLVKGTEEYIKDLVVLQELTGASRKEQEEAREAILAIEELRAAQFEAESRGDRAEVERLQRYFEGASTMMSMGLTNLAKGYAQYAAGGPATADAAAVMQSLPRLIQATERGANIATSLKDLGADLKDASGRISSTVRFGGAEATRGIVPDSFAIVDTVRRMLEQGKSADEVRQELDKMTKTGNKTTQNVVDAERNLQAGAMIMDKVVDKFNGAAIIHDKASKEFRSAVEKFGSIVGTKPPANVPTTPSAPAPAAKPTTGKPEEVISFNGQSGSRNNFDQLDERFKEKVTASATDYFKLTGNRVKLNSAFRDPQKQQELYAEYIARGKTGMPVAPPGTSKHEFGKAVDVQNYGDPNLVAAFNAHGLRQTVPRDPVHFEEARHEGSFSGPSSGYPIILHKDEVASRKDSYQALLSDAANSLTNYRNEVTKQPISSITPLNNQPNAGKLLTELIAMTDDNNRMILSELYKSRLIQEDMLNALRTT